MELEPVDDRQTDAKMWIEVDLAGIMRGFGAVTARPTTVDDVVELVAAARQRQGPTVLLVDRRP
jgi:hypothetical protein